MRPKDKVAVITGAGTGIGEAIALGELVPKEIASPPPATLPLRHSRDGNKKKQIHRAA